MSNQKRDYDSTVARIAGNIAPALCSMRGLADASGVVDGREVAVKAVALARAIVAEVRRTEPSAVPVPLGNHPIGNQGQP